MVKKDQRKTSESYVFNKEDKNVGEWQKVDLNTHTGLTAFTIITIFISFVNTRIIGFLFTFTKKSWMTICSNLIFSFFNTIVHPSFSTYLGLGLSGHWGILKQLTACSGGAFSLLWALLSHPIYKDQNSRQFYIRNIYSAQTRCKIWPKWEEWELWWCSGQHWSFLCGFCMLCSDWGS